MIPLPSSEHPIDDLTGTVAIFKQECYLKTIRSVNLATVRCRIVLHRRDWGKRLGVKVTLLVLSRTHVVPCGFQLKTQLLASIKPPFAASH